jgi:hypothetical protein
MREQLFNRERLIAKVLRDVLVVESYDTYADLMDALKYRLAQLRIPWTPEELSEVRRMVESNRPLVGKARRTADTARREDSRSGGGSHDQRQG